MIFTRSSILSSYLEVTMVPKRAASSRPFRLFFVLSQILFEKKKKRKEKKAIALNL